MWFEYMKERFGYEVIKEDYGFLAYTIVPPYVAIQDVYIKPGHRHSNYALKFIVKAQEIGKAHNCQFVWLQVQMNDKNKERNLRAVLACGFKLTEADSRRIILTKEIGG